MHVTVQGGAAGLGGAAAAAAAAAVASLCPELTASAGPATPPLGRRKPIRVHAAWPRLGALLGARPSLRLPARPSVSQAGSRSE